MSQPELLSIPFARDASGATKNKIPDAPGGGAPAQQATWSQGFPAVTMQPLAVGGIPPQGPDFNGVLAALSEHTVFQNKGGFYKFDAAFAAKIRGYSKGAVLLANDGLSLWVSLQDGNTQNFNGATKNQWARVASSGLDSALSDKADKTVSITGTGALTGGGTLAANRTIDLSAASKASLAKADTAVQNSSISQGTGPSQTHVMSQKAVTDALNTKANTTTQVIAGTGLSGGGAINTDRTLSAASTAIPLTSAYLDAANLNAITAPGYYIQSSSTNSTLARNYPIARPGELQVRKMVNPNSIVQEYTTDNLRVFIRTMINTVWSAWNELVFVSEIDSLRNQMLRIGVGSLGLFATVSAPEQYLVADGSDVSRTTYANLFSVIGTRFGVGNGSTTFRLPDWRGEFFRAADLGRGVDAGREVGTYQHHQFEDHKHKFEGPLRIQDTDRGGLPSYYSIDDVSVSYTHGATGNAGKETRPRNIALLACIRY